MNENYELNENDFNDSLAKSNDEIINEILNKYYHQLFPNLIDVIKTRENGYEKGCQSQLNGIDKILLLSTRELIPIEEKIRTYPASDILLETVSNTTTGAIGWIYQDLWCRYLTYYIHPIEKIFFFDWRTLQLAWYQNREEWLRKYPIVVAKNKGYDSHNVPIPEKVLLVAYTKACMIPQITCKSLYENKDKSND